MSNSAPAFNEADHYTFTAKTLAVEVKKIIKRKKVEPDSIRRSLFLDSESLSKMIRHVVRAKGLISTELRVPFEQQLYEGQLVLELIQAVEGSHPEDIKAASEVLSRLAAFIEKLRTPRELEKEELATAEMLVGYLSALHERGNSLVYSKYMSPSDEDDD